jgi:heme/copper-type cytochrome/quinol oxidase subunit 2
MLPTLAFPLNNGWFATLSVLTLIFFVSIQAVLLYRTMKSVRDYQSKNNGSPFRLNLGAELFWTALPIAMTLGLAWASYPLWLNTR